MSDVAISFLTQQDIVESVIVGMTKEEHITRNERARQLCLTEQMLAEVREATDELKQAMGPNMDLWQGGSDSRVR